MFSWTPLTIEGCFSISKRGMKGVCQQCNKRHLRRYTAGLRICYNNRVANVVNDLGRANVVLMGIVGKWVLYRDPLGV